MSGAYAPKQFLPGTGRGTVEDGGQGQDWMLPTWPLPLHHPLLGRTAVPGRILKAAPAPEPSTPRRWHSRASGRGPRSSMSRNASSPGAAMTGSRDMWSHNDSLWP